jgi:hypothetical protein
MTKLRVSMLSIALLLASGSLAAHHSAAMFDRTKKITVHGTVVRFQYVQPHSWIDVMTMDAAGKEQLWAFEGGAPIQMKMVGLTPDVLKVGDKITITGHPLRDGRSAAAFIELTLPNGKVYNTKPPGGYPGAPGTPPPGAPSLAPAGAPATVPAQPASPASPPAPASAASASTSSKTAASDPAR